MFFRMDEDGNNRFTLGRACVDALGAGMLVLCLLDAVRLCLGIPFHMPGEGWVCTDCP